MRLHIDSKLVGSAYSFVWDDGQILLNDLDPCDWYFRSSGKRHKCIRAASEAAGCNLAIDPCAPQARFWKKHTLNPAWSRILDKEEFRTYVGDQIRSILNFIEDPASSYFLTHYQVQQELIDSLEKGRVSSDSIADQGFIPDSSGFVEVPVYDNAHSSTGRMSITDGPRILTLPRNQRHHLASRWKGGKLIEVDFNSLEARVLGWISGHGQIQDDMYTWIGEKSGAKSAPRAVIKEATLSAVYGMSRRNFALRYQDMPDAVEIYENVRHLMKVPDLDRQLASSKSFSNAFGRPLAETTARISHFIQSSAVDVACHGFHWLADQIDKNYAVPVYLIHDAIVIDAKPEYVSEIQKICKDGLPVSIVGHHFPVKIKEFNSD